MGRGRATVSPMGNSPRGGFRPAARVFERDGILLAPEISRYHLVFPVETEHTFPCLVFRPFLYAAPNVRSASLCHQFRRN